MEETLKQKLDKELKKLKSLTLKQKLDYTWGYYKIPIIVVIVLVIFIYSMTNAFLSTNRNAITLVLCDLPHENIETSSRILNDTFTEYLGDDADSKDMISLDTSVTLGNYVDDYTRMLMQQKLMAMVTGHSANIMIASKDNILAYGALGMYEDLSELLDIETFAKLDELGLLYTTTVPENTAGKEPTPEYTYYCGIDISHIENNLLEEAGFTIAEDTYLAFPVNGNNAYRALEFLDLLFKDTI